MCADNALSLNGIVLAGHALNIGRPGAYIGPIVPASTWPVIAAAAIAEQPELAGAHRTTV